MTNLVLKDITKSLLKAAKIRDQQRTKDEKPRMCFPSCLRIAAPKISTAAGPRRTINHYFLKDSFVTWCPKHEGTLIFLSELYSCVKGKVKASIILTAVNTAIY